MMFTMYILRGVSAKGLQAFRAFIKKENLEIVYKIRISFKLNNEDL